MGQRGKTSRESLEKTMTRVDNNHPSSENIFARLPLVGVALVRVAALASPHPLAVVTPSPPPWRAARARTRSPRRRRGPPRHDLHGRVPDVFPQRPLLDRLEKLLEASVELFADVLHPPPFPPPPNSASSSSPAPGPPSALWYPPPSEREAAFPRDPPRFASLGNAVTRLLIAVAWYPACRRTPWRRTSPV